MSSQNSINWADNSIYWYINSVYWVLNPIYWAVNWIHRYFTTYIVKKSQYIELWQLIISSCQLSIFRGRCIEFISSCQINYRVAKSIYRVLFLDILSWQFDILSSLLNILSWLLNILFFFEIVSWQLNSFDNWLLNQYIEFLTQCAS